MSSRFRRERKRGEGVTPEEQKPTHERRVPLDRERVLRAAITLADAGGIEALSMRRLGRALGVEAMSLYNHVSGKDDILSGIVDIIVGDIDVGRSAADWKAAMRRRSISLRTVFSRHPWALGLLESRRNLGPAALRYLDSVLGVLREAGFSVAMAVRAFSILDSYVHGFCIQEQSMPSGSAAEARELAEQFLRQLPTSEYPHLAAVTVDVVTKAGFDFQKEFESGLDLLLEALGSCRASR
jgi:AcrR family transcriptional regulator